MIRFSASLGTLGLLFFAVLVIMILGIPLGFLGCTAEAYGEDPESKKGCLHFIIFIVILVPILLMIFSYLK